MHLQRSPSKLNKQPELIDSYNIAFAINCLETSLETVFEEEEVQCLDLAWETDNADFLFHMDEELETEILRMFEMPNETGKSLVVFCDENYSRSLSLILFFLVKK